jgi:hypothetical protein
MVHSTSIVVADPALKKELSDGHANIHAGKRQQGGAVNWIRGSGGFD